MKDKIEKELTFYQLCGDDHYVFANRESRTGDISIEVLNHADERVFHEVTNECAWESLVSFSKMVLEQDKKLMETLKC